MNRGTRTILVVGAAAAIAALASFGVYRAIRQIPVREVEVAQAYMVVAVRPLPMGALLTSGDVRLAAWPAKSLVPGGFSRIEAVVDRGLIAPVVENEPLTESKLAPAAAGAGLPPTIPAGMRAISVKVNEVIGVAGFVVPGTRVDVVVIVSQQLDGVSRVVVSNVQVLTAGTRYDHEKAKTGEPIPTTVVTLLVTPSDAEKIALAETQGQIMLALRNPLDAAPTTTPGVRTAGLFGQPSASPESVQKVQRVARAKPEAVAPAPARRMYTVEAIRAAKRSEEVVK